MRILNVLLFISLFNISYCQKNVSNSFSLKTAEQINDMENDLKTVVAHVEVLETCLTNPDWCGNIAFASTSLVKILDGKYQNQMLHISELCRATSYELNRTYILKIETSPKFGVAICNDEVYYVDGYGYIKEKRFPMLFGKLE